MYFRPIISPEVLDELMGRPYLIVFFPKPNVSRYLEFRQDTSPLCWHLISQKLTSYTALRAGWVKYLRDTRGVTVSHGIAFFKKGVLKNEMEGFDKDKFLETLKEFDALSPDEPASIPLKCESGIAIYKNRVLLHQLEDKTLKFFEQCVKDLHTSSTLPPVSPTLSYSVDVYTMRGSVHTPLILPPSSKSFDEYVPLRGSTSTLNSYVSVEKVAPAPAPVHVAPCKQEVTQEDAACCIIM
ncbi:hypothetical protein GGF49_005553 [Coemansia sp. RSA 1853]|nr:hypothetical protein GGF49_005553 [Coemansia sp. RSA 1853]